MHKSIRYALSIAAFYGAITLPFNFWGHATMIGDAWPVIKAFLPWIGSTLAVGIAILVPCMIVEDVKKSRAKKKNHLLEIMNFIVDKLNHELGKLRHIYEKKISRSDIEKIKSQSEIYKKELICWELAPSDISNDVGWVLLLSRVIPYVENNGIKAAQIHTKKLNQLEKENKSQKSS